MLSMTATSEVSGGRREATRAKPKMTEEGRAARRMGEGAAGNGDAGTTAAPGGVASAVVRGVAEGRDTASSGIRVLCVDDHAVLIEGMKSFFAIDNQIVVVGQLDSTSKLMEEVDRLSPDVVTLDIELPGPDAFEMADRLTRARPNVRVIVLSAHIRDAYISASYTSGACAYFAKSDELEGIVAGIRQIVRDRNGGFLLGPKVRERCAVPAMRGGRRSPNGGQRVGGADGGTDEGNGVPRTLLESLTVREREILRLIGKGHSRMQIAAQLCRSVKTVDAHQSRMMKKLGIEARADLMRFAIREGLAEV